MLYEQIESNKQKTILIVIFFVLLDLLVGASASIYMAKSILPGIIIAFIITCIYVPISIINSTKIVMKLNNAKKITIDNSHFLWNTIEGLALAAHVPMPEIYIIEEDSPNAFAAGFSPNKASIAVTTALLQKLSREEIEAVLAHEMAHIKSYDIRLQTISLALVAIIVKISEFTFRVVFKGNNKNSNPILLIASILFLILSPIIAYIMHFALSRNREFQADAIGAELCRNPKALSSALHKISLDNDPVDNIPISAAGMYFSEPFKKAKEDGNKPFSFNKWFATHPPVEQRIERLINM